MLPKMALSLLLWSAYEIMPTMQTKHKIYTGLLSLNRAVVSWQEITHAAQTSLEPEPMGKHAVLG